ncbi:MAG TPA: HAMP domain-containing sensor histidine kinase [Jatrophihabitans sp.]|jgi:signal transduction histidine kinase
MRLTPRRRFATAMLVSWPVGLLYLAWLFYNGVNVIRWYRSGFVNCSPTYLTLTNGCGPTNYNVTLAWVEIVAVTALMVGFGLMLGRWVLRPFGQMAETVSRLGPTSLGLRLQQDGPRDESSRLADAIDELLDRVAEGYEAQTRFAANASHELRTPLATQRALIEVSLSQALTREQLDLLSRQLLATNARNEALIEGLLVLAETERGLVANTPQRLDLITAAVVETFRPAAKEAGIDIDAALQPVEISGEAPLLERLATNLVQNAIKYNEPDGWVQVRVGSDGSLVVANSGVRVASDQVSGLFEPFRRGSGDRLDHGGGVGLGLTIARSVVAAHSGTITAVPNPDGGLRVTVTLQPGDKVRALRSHDDER